MLTDGSLGVNTYGVQNNRPPRQEAPAVNLDLAHGFSSPTPGVIFADYKEGDWAVDTHSRDQLS